MFTAEIFPLNRWAHYANHPIQLQLLIMRQLKSQWLMSSEKGPCIGWSSNSSLVCSVDRILQWSNKSQIRTFFSPFFIVQSPRSFLHPISQLGLGELWILAALLTYGENPQSEWLRCEFAFCHWATDAEHWHFWVGVAALCKVFHVSRLLSFPSLTRRHFGDLLQQSDYVLIGKLYPNGGIIIWACIGQEGRL